MDKFKRKPRSKNEFFDAMDEINSEQEKKEDVKKKSGRPMLPDEIKTKKTSVSIRRSDEEIIDNVIDKLVSNGFKKPFPTSSEIHRMGILSLKDMPINTLIQYYYDSKI